MAEQKLIIAYWNFQGVAQVSRYLLEYCGLDYENKIYQNMDEWFQNFSPQFVKEGFIFVNLPYLIDGDFRLSESSAIEKYIIKKANKQTELLGKSFQEQAIIDMLIGVIRDYFSLFQALSRSQDVKNDKIKLYNESIKSFFELMSKQLGNNTFLTGNSVSYADFFLYQSFQYFLLIYKAEFANFVNLVAFIQHFEELPQIKQYINSARFMKEVIPQRIAALIGI